MASTPPSEKTPLLASLSQNVNELTDTTPPRPYKKQTRCFPITVTAAITFLITLAALATVYFFFLKSKDSEFPLYRRLSPEGYNDDDLNALLKSSWPRRGPLTASYPASTYITIVQDAVDHGKDRWRRETEKEKQLEKGKESNKLLSSARKSQPVSEADSQHDEEADDEVEDGDSTSDNTNTLSDLGYIENEATKYLKEKDLNVVIDYNATKELKWSNESGCARLTQNVSCKASPYRTLDGFCNNVRNPRWGTAMQPLRRALPAAYADGVSEPRGGFDSNLPSASHVSAHVGEDSFDGHQSFSEMILIWGEFVNNDLGVAAKYKPANGEEIDCCEYENDLKCFPVVGNSSDEESVKCVNYVRSLAALRCSFGPREQLNEVSSFLDGSLLYGNTEYLGEELRKHEDGQLDVPREKAHAWLPPVRAAVEGYDPEASWGASFKARGESSSHEPLAGYKPIYDPDTPWTVAYDQKGQSQDGSWNSWIEKEVPWEKINEARKHEQKKEKKKSRKGKKQFSALGDFRPTEYAEAGSMRSLLQRQHNRVAETLKAMHPEWSDETVFQESKRIVTAQMQHITYNEYLPNILGHDVMQKLDLYPTEKGHWKGYDETVDPTVSNQFAVAASKLSRAALEKQMKKKSEAEKQSKEDNIQKGFDHMQKQFDKIPQNVKENPWFQKPFEMLKGNLDVIFKGIFGNSSSENATETTTAESSTSSSTTTESSTSSSTTTESTSSTSTTTTTTTESSSASSSSEDRENSGSGEKKRSKRATTYELDPASYDIQRGRDHGLPGYAEWRKYCNLPEVNTFSDLKSVLTEAAFKNISKLYKSIQDIDLYTGALGEKPIPGGIAGPTTTCLLTDQFYRVKHGDRYWYETQEKPQAFTNKQLGEIKKTSLAGILCANIDSMTHAPGRAMWVVDENNKLVSCSDIEQPDLSHWYEPATHDSNYYATNILSSTESQESDEEFQRLKPYLDKLELNLNLSRPEWGALKLPSYITDNLSNRTSKADAVLHYELDQMAGVPARLACNVTLQTRRIEIFRKSKAHRFMAPREILIDVLQNQLLIWSPNASDSLNTGFRVLNKTGNFLLDVFNASQNANYSCVKLKPECTYYSKVVLGDLVDEDNLFEVSVSTVADSCSVIAPVLLQGYYVDEKTFYWTGAVTLYVDEDRELRKEGELSFQSPVGQNWFTFPRLNGTFTVRDHGKWDGQLPVVMNISSLAWYATPDTLIYPVEWSGFYEGRTSYDGVFLLPQKRNETYVKWYDGEFSIVLPKILPDTFRDLIRSNRVYASVIYFTSNPSGIGRFDTSEFNKLNDWVFADYSRIIVIGQFDDKGRFHWNGDISIHMAPLTYEYASTTYRPYGKYLFKILEGNLYAQLGNSGSVKKWWSGVLPENVIIPSGEYDVTLRAHVLDQYLIWSFDNFTATDGNGTFRMYQSQSQFRLWGDFEFQFAFLMDGIWTSNLKPNVTYFSPILLQYERMTFDFGDDMPERLLLAYQRKDLGVLAPITLLGEFHNSTAFDWNSEALVTVIQK